MTCGSCGSETKIHLIDIRVPLGSVRRAHRYCPTCVPEPGRVFVADRREEHPEQTRLDDLLVGMACSPLVM